MASSAFPQATFIDFMGATGEVPQDFLSGSIASMSSSSKTGGSRMQDVDLHTDFDTLEEPIRDTVRRDVRTVGAKFQHVLFPGSSDRKRLLKEWDLWGPLFICVFLSLLLHSQGGDAAPQFTQVFSLTFFGSIVVTLNIKLLGGEISFFQSLCVIGYCLLPPYNIRSSVLGSPLWPSLLSSSRSHRSRLLLGHLCGDGFPG
ncbi:unnamed protein product, partial [Mesorhabditis spiculigera]